MACNSDLLIDNLNNPDVGRVLARPTDVEATIANSYGQMHQSAFGINAMQPSLLTMAFENASSLANFQMGPRGSIPRISITNTRGNAAEGENNQQFTRSARAARTAANGIVSLNKPNFTIGTPAADQRARAFAYLVMGAANGNVALVYDSLSVVTPEDDLGGTAELVGYAAGMAIALQQIDSAIAIAGRAPGFTLPLTWINGNAATSAQLIQVANGWKARLRAGVARTPAERAAVNWDAVIAEAGAALPTDLLVTMSNAAGSTWTIGDGQHYTYDTWTQASPMIIGMADSARGCAPGGDCYDGWLQTSLNSRYRFLIKTADQRFPSGEARDDQRTSSGVGDFPTPPRTNLYFRNRRPTDPAGDAFSVSQYDFYRYQDWANTRNGPYPTMMRAEMDLLMAEGYIRKGDFASAMTKINVSRQAKGGLPALTGITSLTQAIGASGSCVPRVPQAPNFNTAACGTIFEAMKWEKRLETAYTQMGGWYIDSRGWGDLAEGTAVHFPVPFQEMDARAKPFYSLGGVGGPSSAAKGSYGY